MYEYACKDCGARFETRQRFTDAPLTVCPTCGGSIKRVIHAAGIVFKGSGWYITDSRSTANTDTGTETTTAAPAPAASSAAA
ncbi:MAG: zinc ribbon domain-containing protein [Dehalococcoidia bacterium]|nr:zinc ribbon domain-containing protein [Dehalococcoidia bacterium]